MEWLYTWYSNLFSPSVKSHQAESAPGCNSPKVINGDQMMKGGRGGTSILYMLFTKKYVSVEEVPIQYREKHINTAYRQPYSSMGDCIVSAFRLNNETFNIWTHLIPFIYLLFHFIHSFPSQLWPSASIPTQYYPLLTMELSVCAYLLGSTIAHTFNCMSPRIRHICFYVDYAAISMFGIGGACTTFYYLRPLDTGFFLFESANVFIGGAALCNLFAVYTSCASRHRWEHAKYVIRTLAFTVPFIYGNSPTFIRFLMCAFGTSPNKCSTSLVYLFLGWTSYLLAAILNATRVPEKYIPNVFDIMGHNHQWVHIVTTVGTLYHFWAVQVDLEARKDLMPVLLEGITGWSSLGWMIGTFCITITIAVWFGSQLATNGHIMCKQKEQ